MTTFTMVGSTITVRMASEYWGAVAGKTHLVTCAFDVEARGALALA